VGKRERRKGLRIALEKEGRIEDQIPKITFFCFFLIGGLP